jgi:hypothetical protein
MTAAYIIAAIAPVLAFIIICEIATAPLVDDPAFVPPSPRHRNLPHKSVQRGCEGRGGVHGEGSNGC